MRELDGRRVLVYRPAVLAPLSHQLRQGLSVLRFDVAPHGMRGATHGALKHNGFTIVILCAILTNNAFVATSRVHALPVHTVRIILAHRNNAFVTRTVL